MHTRYDQLAKSLLSALLRPIARVEIEREIAGHVMLADLWVEPESERAAEQARLGVLGAMIDVMEALRNLEEVYAEWEKEVRLEGERRGLLEGERRGLLEGERRGLLEGIEALCSVLDIELTAERRRALASWDVAQLEAHLAALRTTRRWPGD